MTYDKDVFGPPPKKKRAVFHHPMGFELYDALAMDLHAMTYAEQCVAAVRAKSAEADLLEALQQYGIGFTDESAARAEFGDYEVDRELRRRAAIAKATGEHQ
mgnify:FL=1